MAEIRTNCPSCGQVDMTADAISLEVERDGESGSYAFTCPDCSAGITKRADRKIVALLLAAGVRPAVEAGSHEDTAPALPVQDRSPAPEAPAFTLDDLIAFHFLLDDDAWLSELS
jgi:hypothetical protein